MRNIRFIVNNGNLASYVRRLLIEKRLSTYDVARRSGGGVSQSTVNKIVNGDIRSNSVETLVALAKGLDVPEEEVFRAARGLETPSNLNEILAEAFGGQELSPADWVEIEAVIKLIIEQKKALRSAAGSAKKPATSSFKRRKA